jgi:hypothetical protein
LGRRPSFVWSSILKAKHFLKNGMGWRVGNGENIKIWGDAWLPLPQVRLFPPPLVLLPDSKVSMLIDPATGWWNLDLVGAPTDGKGFFMCFMERFDPEELVEALTVTRMIWSRRNDFVFNKGFTSPAQLMFATKSSLEGFSQAASSEVVSPKALPMHYLVWKKPRRAVGRSIGTRLLLRKR